MKFRDAEKKLKSMYGGHYCSLFYRKTYLQDKTEKTECEIYVADLGTFFKGDTWEQAFTALDKRLHPENHLEAIPNE